MGLDVSTEIVAYGFARRLETIRSGMNLTQEEISTVLEIPFDLYSEIESGQVEAPLHILARISEITGYSLQFLLVGLETATNYDVDSMNPTSKDDEINTFQVSWWRQDEKHRLIDTWYPREYPKEMGVNHGTIPRGIGKTRWERYGADPYSDPHWGKHLADLDARRPFRDFVIEGVDRDGRRYCLTISGSPVFDAEGKFKGFCGFSRKELFVNSAISDSA